MKANPCILCRKQPTVGLWAGSKYAVYCCSDPDTHWIQCNGATPQQAVRRWNRLNPLKEARSGR